MTNYRNPSEFEDEQQDFDTSQENETGKIDFPHREQLEKQLTTMEIKADEYRQQMARAQAELENVRKRSEREIEKAYKFGAEQLLVDLLPVLDSLTRGLEGSSSQDAIAKSMRHGMQLTLNLLEKTLEKHGIEVINPAKGESFNPQLHEAISMQENLDTPPNSVIEVLQKGYQLNGRVLRPARLVVAR